MTRWAPRVVAAAALAARVIAVMAICGVIAIAGFVAGCDRIVNLTPFYDGGLDGIGLADAPLFRPDSAPFDGGIAIPDDGARLDGGGPFLDGGGPFLDGGGPFPDGGFSDGSLVR